MNLKLAQCDATDFDAVVQRLESIYLAGSPELVAIGAQWYAERHRWLQTLAGLYGVDVERLAYVASALSPNTRWRKNETAMLQHLVAYANGQTECPRSDTLYGTSDAKAWAILNGAPFATIGQGFKTNAFAPNLLEREVLPDTLPAVTVDTIFHQAATGRVPKNGIGAPAYRTIRKATLFLAKKYGMPAYVFQAIVWCIFRGSGE